MVYIDIELSSGKIIDLKCNLKGFPREIIYLVLIYC